MQTDEKFRRFFLDEDLDVEKLLIFNLKLYHYLCHVLRVKEKNKIIIFNQEKEVLFSIEEISKKYITLFKDKILRLTKNLKYVFNNVIFLIPIIKLDRFLSSVDMLVQMEILNIQPTFFSRSQYNYVNEKKVYSRIVASVEQSNGMRIPRLLQSKKLLDCLLILREEDILIYANHNFIQEISFTLIKKLNNILKDGLPDKKLFLLVGPEGGFSDEEICLLQSKNNCHSIMLTNTILRSETACVVLLSKILFLLQTS